MRQILEDDLRARRHLAIDEHFPVLPHHHRGRLRRIVLRGSPDPPVALHVRIDLAGVDHLLGQLALGYARLLITVRSESRNIRFARRSPCRQPCRGSCAFARSAELPYASRHSGRSASSRTGSFSSMTTAAADERLDGKDEVAAFRHHALSLLISVASGRSARTTRRIVGISPRAPCETS